MDTPGPVLIVSPQAKPQRSSSAIHVEWRQVYRGANLNPQHDATMNMRNPILLFAAFLFALQFNPPSQAAIIRNVSVTNVYSEFVSGTDLRTATNLLNGSGLFGDHH